MSKEIIPNNLPPELSDDFWLKLAQDQALMIYNDATNHGIMQDGSSNHKYSAAYAKRKANYMRRTTSGEALLKTKKGKPLYFRNPKIKGKTLGERTGIYKGVQVVDNNVAFVNMRLTGATFRGLLKSPMALGNNRGCKIGYDLADAGKVIGNDERGYKILGLRKKNVETTMKQILDKFDEKLKVIWEDNITITVG